MVWKSLSGKIAVFCLLGVFLKELLQECIRKDLACFPDIFLPICLETGLNHIFNKFFWIKSFKVLCLVLFGRFFFWKQFIRRHGNFVLVALRLRAAAVGALATMETLTLQSGRKISDAATLEYKRAYLVYRAGLNKLASDALQKRVCRYHLHPKNHQLGHIANHFLPKNPRYFANFLSEDFIYKAKVLAEKTHALFMSKQVLERYAIWVCLRWRDWAKEKIKGLCVQTDVDSFGDWLFS